MMVNVMLMMMMLLMMMLLTLVTKAISFYIEDVAACDSDNASNEGETGHCPLWIRVEMGFS